MSNINDIINKIAASNIRGNPLLRQQFLNKIDENKKIKSYEKKENNNSAKNYYNSQRWKEKCFNIRYNTNFPNEFD